MREKRNAPENVTAERYTYNTFSFYILLLRHSEGELLTEPGVIYHLIDAIGHDDTQWRISHAIHYAFVASSKEIVESFFR